MVRRMPNATLTLQCDPLEAPGIKSILEGNGFIFGEAPYAFWRAKSPTCSATFYTKGKLVLQGADATLWADTLTASSDGVNGPEDAFNDALALHPKPLPDCWVGIDETGKGDYFGPLVVVAAAVTRDRIDLLRELGVGDSKKITDKKIQDMATEVKACCRYSKVIIGPERYNQLYAKIGNLNRLLAWAHARALEDVLEKAPDASWALSDQFAKNTNVVESQLMERGRNIRYAQRTKAESDPAVAVASILARHEFLWQLKKLGQVAGRTIPKGAGPPVLAAAREIVSLKGKDILPKVAKLHFRTTEQI